MSYKVVVSSLVRNVHLPLSTFEDQVLTEVRSWHPDVRLAVFPEYMWRTTATENVIAFASGPLADALHPEQVVVLGTVDIEQDDCITNSALVLHNKLLRFVPKTKVLTQDRNNGVARGINPGVIEFPLFRLAVLVCADLWDVKLCYKLAIEQGANVFAVPAWTATRKGGRAGARREWHALARTRSMEYGIVVAVADHAWDHDKTDVANATSIFSFEDRSRDPIGAAIDLDIADSYHEALSAVTVHRDSAHIEPQKLVTARIKWDERGLAQS